MYVCNPYMYVEIYCYTLQLYMYMYMYILEECMLVQGSTQSTRNCKWQCQRETT